MAQRFDLSGNWGVDINYGESAGTCAFAQTDMKLSGTCGENPGTTVFPAEGVLTGRDVTWRVAAEQDGNRTTVVFAGRIDERGTTITGTVQIGDADPVPFQASKISEPTADA